MDGGLVIKEEPLDWDDADDFLECGSQSNSMQYGVWDQVEVRMFNETNNNMAEELCAESGLKAFDDAAILKSCGNIITVNVAESIKTEDEISFINQMMAEENKMHDPALIIPTDLEMYAKGMKSATVQTINKDEILLHKCRRNCDKVFNTLTERALHETHEHTSLKRSIKCNFCCDTFENFFALTRHMSEHRDVQRYICSYCSKNFNCFSDLQNHWKNTETCKGGVEEQQQEKGTILKQFFDEIHTKTTDLQECKDNIPLLSKMSSSSAQKGAAPPKALSFAEEVKAFAAKYQLKTVARKRTSAFSLKPIAERKKRKQDFDIEPNYVVPTAINNFMCPLPDLKIKEEPVDDQEMAPTVTADCFDQIQIKNEPHDNHENFITKNLISSEETTGSMLFDNNSVDMSDKLKVKKGNLKQNVLPNQFEFIKKIVQPEKDSNGENVSSNQANHSLETIISSTSQQLRQPNPKILLSKANFLSMKNVKILKFGSQAKIVKFPPSMTAQTSPSQPESPEDKKFAIQENANTFNKLPNSNAFDASIKPDVDAMHLILPSKEIKVEPTAEHLNYEFPEFKDGIDEKSDVMLNITESMIRNALKTKRVLPKWLIRYMEEQPEKKKMIDDLQRQFQNAKEIMNIASNASTFNNSITVPTEKPTISPSKSNEIIASEALPPLPESFFLKVTDDCDKELMIVRRQYRNHYYAWICPMCYKEYSQKHTFVNHLIGTHKIANDKLKNFTVEVKPILLTNVKPEQNLSSTQKRKDAKMSGPSNVKPRYGCSKCSRIYLTKQALIDHESSDCGRLPLYVCPVCSKPFASKSTLSCHMTIHTGELPYQCKHCEKRFRTNGQIRVHLRKHTGEKPFKCQICSLSFTHRETLISHLSRHMDIKRYICKGCNKRFSTISALTTHRNVRPTTCGTLELDSQAVGPLIRVVNGQVIFEPQRGNNGRTRRKICQEILTEIQNIPKNKEPENQEEQNES